MMHEIKSHARYYPKLLYRCMVFKPNPPVLSTESITSFIRSNETKPTAMRCVEATDTFGCSLWVWWENPRQAHYQRMTRYMQCKQLSRRWQKKKPQQCTWAQHWRRAVLVQGHQSTLNTPRKKSFIRIIRLVIGRPSKPLGYLPTGWGGFCTLQHADATACSGTTTEDRAVLRLSWRRLTVH